MSIPGLPRPRIGGDEGDLTWHAPLYSVAGPHKRDRCALRLGGV